VKDKSLVVAASVALMLTVSVPAARAEGMDQPWSCAASFVECLVQGVLNVL
jgi:hypothetical protein